MTTRKYSSRSQQTTLSGALTSNATTTTVVSGSTLVGGVTISAGELFTVVIDPDTALEEIVDVSAISGNTLTIVRGIDGSTGVAHSAGAVVRHMAIGRDYREANTHIENTTTAHGITLANLVKTTDTGTVTSTMITNNTIVDGDINSAAGISDTKLGTISTALKVANSATTATSANTASTIVARDASGNFSATTVTAALIGASTSTTGNAATVTNGVYTTDTGTVTSTMILDGTILNADINASAAIAYSKLALTGTIVSTDIANDTIVNADINTAAAISLSKLATDPLARANHTGTQLAATVSDFDTQVRTSRLDQMAVPTATVSVNSQKITNLDTPTASADAANKGYVDTQITNLIAAAPGALDTLDELAAALGDDANFATTVTNNLATKLPLAGGTMSGAIAMGTNKITGLGTPTVGTDATTKTYVDGVLIAPSNLTGPITSVGSATSIASQTGTGTKFVVDTSPTIVTPTLSGATVAGTINGTTIPSTKTLVVTTDKLSTLAATTSAELAGVISDETGSGSLVFATSPTLVTPALGTPSAVVLTSGTGLPISTGVSGLGTGVATALAVAVGSAGAPVVFNGAGGTPSSINLTNATNTPSDATKANLASPTFTGTVTIPTGAVITSPKIASTYTAKTAAYTFASGDEGQLFSMNNAATQQFNIPTDATFNFAVGTEINVFWITGAGQPTIGAVTPGTTTVISTGATSATPKLRVANSGATCKKLAANSWIVFGDLA